MKEVAPKVKLLSYTPEPEKAVATAAKLCYSDKSADDLFNISTNEEAEKFLKRLPSTHGTPLEQADFTFSIEGISRSTSHQLVRHRLMSFNQRSQRYVSETDFNYVIPEPALIAGGEKIRDMYIRAMESSYGAYNDIIDELIKSGINEKQAYENARYVLPNACETKMILKANARELLHFFNQRCCTRAQDEIQDVANQMLRECKKVAPVLFRDAGPFCVGGNCPEGNMSCGKSKEMREYYGSL